MFLAIHGKAAKVDKLPAFLPRKPAPVRFLDDDADQAHRIMLIRLWKTRRHCQQLANSDVQERRNAAKALGELKSRWAVSSLIHALGDSDEFVRGAAAVALGQIGHRSAAGPLTKALADDRLSVQRAAANALLPVVDAACAKPLVAVLGRDRALDATASACLQRIGEPAVAALLPALAHRFLSVRQAAAAILNAMNWRGETPGQRALLALASGKHDEVASTGVEGATNLLVLMESADEDGVEAAARGLGRIGDRRAVGPLCRCLQSDNDKILVAAAEALGALPDPDAITPLVTAFERCYRQFGRYRAVLEAVTRSLGRIGEPAIGPLADIVRKAPGTCSLEFGHALYAAAAQALGAIGPAGLRKLYWLLAQPGDWETEVLQELVARDPCPTETADQVLRAIVVSRPQDAVGLGNAAVPALVELLRTSDARRRVAARALGEIGDPLAVAELLRHIPQCPEAAEALARIGDRRAVPGLIEAVRRLCKNQTYSRWDECVAAVTRALVRLQDSSAVRPLVEALPALDQAALEAAEALGWSPASTQERAYRALFTGEWDSVLADGPAAADVLLALSQATGRDAHQVQLARALGRLGDHRATPRLVQWLRGSNVELQRTSAEALGRIGDPEAVSSLTEAVRRSTSEARLAAIEALGLIGDPRTETALLAISPDENVATRRAAARVLGKVGSAAAIDWLVSALGAEPEEVIEILAQLTARIGTPAFEKLLSRVRENRCLVAIQVLGRLGDRRATQVLCEALQHIRHHQQAAVVTAVLGGLGDPQATACVEDFLNASESDRISAVKALADRIGREAAPALAWRLSGPDERMRLQAKAELLTIGDAAHVQLVEIFESAHRDYFNGHVPWSDSDRRIGPGELRDLAYDILMKTGWRGHHRVLEPELETLRRLNGKEIWPHNTKDFTQANRAAERLETLLRQFGSTAHEDDLRAAATVHCVQTVMQFDGPSSLSPPTHSTMDEINTRPIHELAKQELGRRGIAT